MKLILDNSEALEGIDIRFISSSQHVFRELSFDPVSNVRRGTCYTGNDNQPVQWFIRDDGHGDYGSDHKSKSLITFNKKNISHQLKNASLSNPLICLGGVDNFTIGVVTSVETTVTGVEIISLKMRQVFGVFPEMVKDHSDQEGCERIEYQLQKVKESYYNSLPESVVDRCRDAVSEILGVYLKEPKKDLYAQIQVLQKLDTNKKRIVEAAADIVRLFHARAKPSMKAKHEAIPEIVEQDAELAVQCLGVVLRDLGYAKW